MKKRQMTVRIVFLFVISVLFLCVIMVRLAQFQVVEGKELLNKARNEITTVKTIPAARGNILDRYGRVLAGNKTSFCVMIDRSGMKENTLNQTIAQMLELSEQEGFIWENLCPLYFKNKKVEFDEKLDSIALKKSLRIKLTSTAEECKTELLKYYKLNQNEKNFDIARVRYSMKKVVATMGKQYVFAKDLSVQAVATIEEQSQKIEGIKIEEISVREYQNENVASHLIGDVGPIYAEEYHSLKEKGYAMNEVVGKSGIERTMQDELRGQDGKIRVMQSRNGEIIHSQIQKETRVGSDITLTIDFLLQKKLQELLADFVSKAHSGSYSSKGGAIVMLDVKTGEILAAVNSSNYTIEEYKKNYQSLLKNESNPLFNRPLLGVYRPGSSLKPMVAVAALEEDKLDINEHLLCQSPFYYKGQPYSCLQDHHSGYIPLTEALHWSCNTFFYRLGLRLGIDTLNQYAAYMGLGQKTGLEIPQAKGRFASPETTEQLGGTWYPGDLLQASIGQNETAVSPLQMACEAMTIANKGIRYETHLVKSIAKPNGEIVKTIPKVASQFEMDDSTYNVISKGMSLAASKVGLDSSIAQKTGTAQTSSANRFNHDFIAFLPIDDPEIAVSCIVEDCSGGTAGLLKEILKIYEECKVEGYILQSSQ